MRCVKGNRGYKTHYFFLESDPGKVTYASVLNVPSLWPFWPLKAVVPPPPPRNIFLNLSPFVK